VAFFTALPGTIGALVSFLWAQVVAFFTTGAQNAVSQVQSLPGRILAALSGLRDRLFDLGKNMIFGLIDGIKATVGRAIDAVKRAMADIVAGAKKALGIASPSKVFADAVGVQIPAGIEQGIASGVPSLQAMLADVTSPTVVAGQRTQGQAGALSNVVINLGGVHFSGVVPTDAEARRAGAMAAAGAADALRRRDIALAVRQV